MVLTTRNAYGSRTRLRGFAGADSPLGQGSPRSLSAPANQAIPVNRLSDIVDKSPAAVPQHLPRLRAARIVVSRQKGTRVFYRLTNEDAWQLVLDAILQAEHADGAEVDHHHDRGA